MNKKGALINALFSLLVLSVVAGTQLVFPVVADPYPLHFPPAPTISVQSPKNGTTYPELMPIEFTVVTHPAPIGGESNITARSLRYTIDGLNVVPLNFTLTVTSDGEWHANLTYHYSFLVQKIVPLQTVQRPIGAGNHIFTITVYSEIGPGYGSYPTSPSVSASVQFTVHAAPTITLLSPEAKTYNSTDVPLTFTIREPATWMGYSLDSQANVTISGNTTLTGLSEGNHNLTVYAKDTIGNTGASETVHFTAHNQTESQPQQTGFLGSILPMEYGFAIIGATAVAITATTGYFVLKRKRNGVKSK